jgi:hypothetical protein
VLQSGKEAKQNHEILFREFLVPDFAIRSIFKFYDGSEKWKKFYPVSSSRNRRVETQ